MPYHNTTNTKGQKLKDYSKKAKNQERYCYLIFKKNPQSEISADGIWNLIFKERGVPYTSIRRAVSFLYKEGYIIKTGKCLGFKGRMINKYKFNPDK